MQSVEIYPSEKAIVLRARGSELLILEQHIAALKTVRGKDFIDYFLHKALINRPARKLFQAWLRKDSTLFKRVYDVVQNQMDAVEPAAPSSNGGAEAPAQPKAEKKAPAAKKTTAAKATANKSAAEDKDEVEPKAKAKKATKSAAADKAPAAKKKATKKKTTTKATKKEPAGTKAKKTTKKKVTKKKTTKKS